MKDNRVFRILALAIILSLLMLAIPATPTLAAAAVTVNLTSGPVGTAVTVSGTDFTASNTYTITFAYGTTFTQVVAYGTVSTTTFSATFNVPSVPRGQYIIQVVTTPQTFSPTFTVTPQITLSTSSGYVGDTVTVSGSGFNASSTVTIYFDTTSRGTATALSNGTFSGFTFTVPDSIRGIHAVKGSDAYGYSPDVSFNTLQKITVSPTSGAVGSTVTVSGTGFAPSSTVTFYFDDVSIGTTATTNSNGTFSTSTFAIPSTSRGSHTIKAQDASANYVTVTFTVAHKMTITPTSGTSGTSVTVSGTGFGASKPITIKYNNSAVPTTPAAITTSASGSFTASFTVPAGLAGTYAVQASDDTSTASVNFTSTTDATISPTTSATAPGYVGMELTITGNGFKPNTAVTVTYTTDPVTLATVTADASGNFLVKITIPPSTGGSHTITVTDSYTTKEFTFVMESAAPAIPQPLLPLMGDKAKALAYFDWEDVDDSSKPVTYELQVASDADFNAILVEKKGLTTSSYTLTEAEKLKSTKKEAPYHWRLRAIDAASNASGWTGTGTFYVGFAFPAIEGWVLFSLLGAVALLFFFLGLLIGRRRGGSGY